MVEEELDLMLSQSQQHVTLSPDVDDDDDDFNLQLSQSQPPTQQMALADETTVSDVTNLTDSATSVTLSINLVQNMIKKNHELLIKQNNELAEMMSELSVNVADINDRVVSLEKKFLCMDRKAESSRAKLLEVTDKINEMQNSLKCIKKKQAVSGDNKLEERLQLIEEKLKIVRPLNNKAGEVYTLQIKNLPFGQQDNEDVVKLLKHGLGLNIRAQTVDRARSIYNNAGIITIGLRSEAEKEQVMRSKHKLRYTDSYYDVYIDDGVEQRIQQKIQVLMNTMKGLQQQVPSSRNVHPQRYVRGQRPQTNGYQHSD